MPRPLIYLDNHATTRCDPRVVEAMLPYFSEQYGNAASLHAFGTAALDAVNEARSQLASIHGSLTDSQPRDGVGDPRSYRPGCQSGSGTPRSWFS